MHWMQLPKNLWYSFINIAIDAIDKIDAIDASIYDMRGSHDKVTSHIYS